MIDCILIFSRIEYHKKVMQEASTVGIFFSGLCLFTGMLTGTVFWLWWSSPRLFFRDDIHMAIAGLLVGVFVLLLLVSYVIIRNILRHKRKIKRLRNLVIACRLAGGSLPSSQALWVETGLS